jgi:uncharacterized protein YvpB
VVVDGRVYDAYIPAATKEHQAYKYSCEFDAAWVILQTYGISTTIDEQIGIVGQDRRIEPYYKQTPQGLMIYGGDITTSYSGNYRTNFLARSTGTAIRKVFEHYGLRATPVNSRAGVEAALRGGSLVWIKTTADFKPGRRATWVMPNGRKIQTVFSNDHAAVVIGFNATHVVIRDVLGPTATNRQRKYEYLVPWATFLSVWGQQGYDGLAIARPRR